MPLARTSTLLTLSSSIADLRPSATLAINELSAKLISEDKKVYRLGFGQSPFPVPDIVVAALQKYASQKDYLPVKGLWPLREAVAKFNNRIRNIDCNPEQILIGPGSKELIYQLQLAVDGRLLLPSPSWVSYEPQAHLAGRKVTWIDTDPNQNWCLSPESLEKACLEDESEFKILILNYPGNPTGTTYSDSQLQELANILRKYEVLVVADEIYGAVHHDGAHHTLYKYYSENTIVSSGLSKWCGAGGWRLGTFTFPESLMPLSDVMATIASETFTSVSAPIQYAAITAFEDHQELKDYLINSRRVLKAVARYVYDHLMRMNISTCAPQGGFYLFPDFKTYRHELTKKSIKTSTELCTALLEEAGIALLPGVAFGRPPEELTTRLSFVDFDGEQALKAAEKITTPLNTSFVEEHCPQIAGAMAQLKTWLENN